MLDQFQVSGDLAGLARHFLAKEGDTDCALYHYLCRFSSNSRITFRQWWDLLDQLQARYPSRHIGLELGSMIEPEFLSVLGYLVLSCSTVLEALQAFQRYQRLLHEGDRAEAEMLGTSLRISWSNDYGPSTRLSDEVLLAGMVTFSRQMGDDPSFSPLQVDFTFDAPADATPYERVFGCRPNFGAARTALVFPASHLSRRVSHENPGLRSLLESQAQAMLEVLPQKDRFAQQLRDVLLNAIQEGRATSPLVAKRLALSERSLFRRLAEEGLSFQALLTRMRVQLAREYLSSGRLTHSEIALLLGYSEQSAFSRAFRRATGVTPSQYQRSHGSVA